MAVTPKNTAYIKSKGDSNSNYKIKIHFNLAAKKEIEEPVNISKIRRKTITYGSGGEKRKPGGGADLEV